MCYILDSVHSEHEPEGQNGMLYCYQVSVSFGLPAVASLPKKIETRSTKHMKVRLPTEEMEPCAYNLRSRVFSISPCVARSLRLLFLSTPLPGQLETTDTTSSPTKTHKQSACCVKARHSTLSLLLGNNYLETNWSVLPAWR